MKNRNSLKYWESKARHEIVEYLRKEGQQSFVDFMYSFASECDCQFGVMLEFNSRRQRMFLVKRYNTWMLNLKAEIEYQLFNLKKSNGKLKIKNTNRKFINWRL